MRNAIIIITAIIVLTACKHLTKSEKIILNNLNNRVNLNIYNTVYHGNKVINYNDFRKQYKYISIVYLKNNCNSCYHKFIEWQKMTDSITIRNDYTVLFIIEESSYNEFIRNVNEFEIIKDRYYSIIDSNYEFLDNNKSIPNWIINYSMLVDQEDKIKMVGAPWKSKKMTKLFFKICNNGKLVHDKKQ